MLYLILCVGLCQMSGWFLFLVLFLVALLNFWNWTEKKFSKVQNQQQIWEAISMLLPFAIVKVLLWRWRDFLGRNSTACLDLSCICLLIHRAYCCSASRSQLATCRRAEAGSCLSPKGRRNIGNWVALGNVLVGLHVKCKVYFPWRNKPSLRVCKTQHFFKWRGLKTDHFPPAVYSLHTFHVVLWLYRQICTDGF